MTPTLVTMLSASALTLLMVPADQFLDGFPSVPLLDGFEEIVETSVVFDTVAGTIASVDLRTEATNGLDQYQAAMQGLGYICARATKQLQCRKSPISLSFFEREPGVFEVRSRPQASAS